MFCPSAYAALREGLQPVSDRVALGCADQTSRVRKHTRVGPGSVEFCALVLGVFCAAAGRNVHR